MARIVVAVHHSDLAPSRLADVLVRFSFGRDIYEIALTEAEWRTFQRKMGRYVTAARRTGKDRRVTVTRVTLAPALAKLLFPAAKKPRAAAPAKAAPKAAGTRPRAPIDKAQARAMRDWAIRTGWKVPTTGRPANARTPVNAALVAAFNEAHPPAKAASPTKAAKKRTTK